MNKKTNNYVGLEVIVLLLCSKMCRGKKNIISILLAAILLMPIIIKFADGQFHHHHHYSNFSANSLTFEDYHKNCPIASFEYSLFQSNIVNYEPGKYFTADRLTVLQPKESLSNYFDYSFLLRAPPAV